jgi:hypothetical protein
MRERVNKTLRRTEPGKETRLNDSLGVYGHEVDGAVAEVDLRLRVSGSESTGKRERVNFASLPTKAKEDTPVPADAVVTGIG